jgi:hypothetical protein
MKTYGVFIYTMDDKKSFLRSFRDKEKAETFRIRCVKLFNEMNSISQHSTYSDNVHKFTVEEYEDED